MLSDEEKKAIKMIEHIQECNTLIGYRVEDRTILAKALLNLIEKHSKEIEELKTTKKELTERVLRLESDKFWDNVVSKDKIKAKIEELEKQDRENRMSHNYLVIPVLQSLLEKE